MSSEIQILPFLFLYLLRAKLSLTTYTSCFHFVTELAHVPQNSDIFIPKLGDNMKHETCYLPILDFVGTLLLIQQRQHAPL